MQQKIYKGEKYIYLLMAYTLLCNQKSELEGTKEDYNYIEIGEDTGIKGGQNYWRAFRVMPYQGKTLLIEVKTTPHCADFTRAFEIIGNLPKPTIKDYIDEYGDNCGQHWDH